MDEFIKKKYQEKFAILLIVLTIYIIIKKLKNYWFEKNTTTAS
jgi:uncharacterized membrane protein YwzB